MAFRGLSAAFSLLQSVSRRRSVPQRGFSDQAASEPQRENFVSEALRLKDLESRLKAAELEALQFKDYYVRAVAEQENIRKRLSKEIENESNYSITKFAKEMLEVGDNLARAVENTKIDVPKEECEKVLNEFLEGVKMTKEILGGVFNKFNISEFCPMGEKFDPNLHEALVSVEDKGKTPGTVGQVFVNGYKIKDRVLRCAKVAVVKK